MRNTLVLVAGLLALAGCSANPVAPANDPPVVTSIAVGLDTVWLGQDCPLTAVATDPDGDRLSFQWVVGSGRVIQRGSDAVYTATSCCLGGNPVSVIVRDGRGGETRFDTFVHVRQ